VYVADRAESTLSVKITTDTIEVESPSGDLRPLRRMTLDNGEVQATVRPELGGKASARGQSSTLEAGATRRWSLGLELRLGGPRS
jgi:hypothetical protein